MVKFTRFLFGYFLISLFSFQVGFAQCPDAGYTSSAAACAGQAVILTNTSTGTTNYYWDFCGADFSATPLVTRDTLTGTIGPLATTPVFDGTNWYGFIVSDDATIVRLDYGPSLSSIPAFTNLGNIGNEISASHRSNISIFQYAGNWYGMLANQGSGKLITYNFSGSLSNIPTSTSATYAQIGGAWFQHLVVDNGHYYLFVCTFSANISIFDFGTDPTSIPTVSMEKK